MAPSTLVGGVAAMIGNASWFHASLFAFLTTLPCPRFLTLTWFVRVGAVCVPKRPGATKVPGTLSCYTTRGGESVRCRANHVPVFYGTAG